jgi:hypothetical protein
MTSLAQIWDDDLYLDLLGVGISLPEELRDGLAEIVAGWVREVRHNELFFRGVEFAEEAPSLI